MKATLLRRLKDFPDLDVDEKTAKITFLVKPGMRAYVRRIEFRGNTKTADPCVTQRNAPDGRGLS